MPKIVSVRSAGVQQVFDIEVEHPSHQFFLDNGLLTSNCAHAAAYSKVTMQTAYLATYHPLEFYSALLTAGQSAERQDDVSDIKRAGVRVLPMDVNRSKLAHMVEDCSPQDAPGTKWGIRLSLESAKGVGKSAIEKIVAGQPFADFFDFLKRSGASKTSIVPLIAVGAFDRLHKNMRLLEAKYELYLTDGKFKTKRHEEFLKLCSELEVEDYALHEKIALECALMEFSTRGGPFEILGRKGKIDRVFGTTTLTYREFVDGTNEVGMIPVAVRDWKERPQKNKQLYAFVKFATEDGEEFEAVAFSSTWKHLAPRIRKGSVYIATFNRKLDDPESLVVGRPGWGQSASSVAAAFVDVDLIEEG